MSNFLNSPFKNIELNPSSPSFESSDIEMSMKKIGIFGTTGVLLAILVIIGLMASGISFPGFSSAMGTLTVKLTDAPVELSHLNVTITELQILRTGTNETEGGWTTLPFIGNETSFYIDILSLQNVSRDISVAEIQPGNYTKIRLTVSSANATYSDGTIINPLRVPPGHIDIIVHFEIEADSTTVLLVDMTAHISETNNLSPVLKAKVVSEPQ